MTVINVAATDAGTETLRWEVPVAPILVNSPIPRGLRKYGGVTAIAALGANDETSVKVSLTFPPNVYLLKNLTIAFWSDDLTTEFSNEGILEYAPGGSGQLGVLQDYALTCNAPFFRGAVRSIQIYRPLGTIRLWIQGNKGDLVDLFLADISGDASTAGDVAWTAEFWEYDVEQCLEWPVNTPNPVLSY